jgi:23S rRNA (uracil1939-C5)-methyltransferase
LLLTIEKLVYGGDGLAHLPADESGRGKAAFLHFVLAKEKVEASVIEQRAGFVRAQAEKMVEASTQRVAPPCPYFGTCGGCHYQHAGYEHQLEIKGEILRETLRRTAKIELSSEIQVHASPAWNYRNRSRLQVQTTPFQAGYFKMRSHELLPVQECPISSPLINRAIKALWESGRAGSVPAGVREIEFFANGDDSQVMVELSCSVEARRAPIRAWAEEFQRAMPEISGLVAFRDSKGREAPDTLLSVGSNHLTYETIKAAYRVSAGSFFQVNRHMTDELVQIVTAGQSGEVALDLYAGVGLFSTRLAGDFHHVVSVESSQTSSADLAYTLTEN